ncbi:DUF1367 family protein [Flavobacterium sp.]|jgi:hypothetical protein|uniref:DUF1367 family protein n=1 Tax=Flavobacterium sp. TaxID=239 RepID=UPI0037BFA5CB
MAEFDLVRVGDIFRAATAHDLEQARKVPAGVQHTHTVKVKRNLGHHRKTFALLKLAFDSWEPACFVSNVEMATVEKLAEYWRRLGMSDETINAVNDGFISELNRKRSGISLARDFEQFRAYVTVQAGFYDDIHTPAGPKRVPKSISFAKMDQVQFDAYYRAILDVCWQLCLSGIFSNQDELADALLRFE